LKWYKISNDLSDFVLALGILITSFQSAVSGHQFNLVELGLNELHTS